MVLSLVDGWAIEESHSNRGKVGQGRGEVKLS